MSKTNPYAAPAKKSAPKPVEATQEPVEAAPEAPAPEPEETPVESAPEPVEENTIEVPSGMSVDKTLDWVGDDKDRAQAALDAELDGKNRSTLIEPLEEMLEG